MLGQQNIFLIGPMGSGKTAVGKYLARQLDYPFLDSDHEIEQRTGADISLIFEREGEAGFRQRERDVIADLTTRRHVVLATGGGAVLSAATRAELRARGWVVYLETSVPQQVERAGRSRHRPLLQGTDPSLRLDELLRAREPLYRETADLIVSTDHRRVPSVGDFIVQRYQESLRAPLQAAAAAANAAGDGAGHA
jgi:shikimate kinase